MNRSRHARAREAGFTLLEVLAALVLSSLILVSLNMAMGAVGKGVDHTRRSIGEQSEIGTAIDIFGRDVARIAKIRRGPSGETFSGYVFDGSAGEIVYPLREEEGLAAPGLYLVRLRATGEEGRRQLLRERAPVPLGGNMDSPRWQDAVVLLSGDFDVAFAYRAQRSGLRDWVSGWQATERMPEQIRLTITSRDSGRLRVPGYVQSLAIDAEVECAGGGEPPCAALPSKEQGQ